MFISAGPSLLWAELMRRTDLTWSLNLLVDATNSRLTSGFITSPYNKTLNNCSLVLFPLESQWAWYFCRCIVPGINLLTPVLDFGKCFVNHPYEMTMELMNDSDLPAKYELIAQVRLNWQMIKSKRNQMLWYMVNSLIILIKKLIKKLINNEEKTKETTAVSVVLYVIKNHAHFHKL
jgi:hypothetical protein